MDLKLKGKKAIITGATRGIGKRIAQLFLAEGIEVAICGRNKKNVDETVNELSANGKIYGQALDIHHHQPLENWINTSANLLGGLDILVMNAGALAATNADVDWLSNFHVDLMGAVHATSTAIPFLAQAARQTGDAAIIYISSISASESYGESSYGPIKAALIHYAKGVALEHAHQKIRANVISPGPIYADDGFWHKMEVENPSLFKEVLSKAPLQRMGTPEEIASAVAFLASPLSAFTTGTNFVIDGGYSKKVWF